MKKLCLSLILSIASTAAIALPLSEALVKQKLNAKNVIQLTSDKRTALSNFQNLTCEAYSMERTIECRSGGIYIVQGNDFKVKLYISTCKEGSIEGQLIPCANL
jgi:hypothetical protein